MAIGVAVLVAVIGTPASLPARLDAFRHGWWIMVAITLVALLPALALLRPRRAVGLAAAE